MEKAKAKGRKKSSEINRALEVLLVVGFFVGVGIFVMKDQKAHGHEDRKEVDHGQKPV